MRWYSFASPCYTETWELWLQCCTYEHWPLWRHFLQHIYCDDVFYLLLSCVFAGCPSRRNVVTYECCPEEYVDVTFTVQIRRRKLYYVFNLVVPCLFLSFLSLTVFAMPPDCGEKITMGRFFFMFITMGVYPLTLVFLLLFTSRSASKAKCSTV